MNTLEYASQFGNHYRKVSTHNGGEYAGPCLACGGTDRMHIQPNHPNEYGSFMCRNCTGDIWKNAPQLVLLHRQQAYSAADYREACTLLQMAPADHPGYYHTAPPPANVEAPNTTWQAVAEALCETAEHFLWAPTGEKARAYLHSRGLTDETIKDAHLGYTNQHAWMDAGQWGLEQEAKVYIPRGIIIPWVIGDQYWRINVRLPAPRDGRSYTQIAGGKAALYNADAIRTGMPVVVVEGEFDCLSVQQEVQGLAAAVATGSITHARSLRWVMRLSLASDVLVAFDAEADKGDVAAQWWIDNVGTFARRLRPVGAKDCNAMLQAGIRIYPWLRAALDRPRVDAWLQDRGIVPCEEDVYA